MYTPSTRAPTESHACAPQGDKVASCQHGIKAAVDILDFLIELIKKDPGLGREHIEETIMFALDMIHTGVGAAALVACVHVCRHTDGMLRTPGCRVRQGAQ